MLYFIFYYIILNSILIFIISNKYGTRPIHFYKKDTERFLEYLFIFTHYISRYKLFDIII